MASKGGVIVVVSGEDKTGEVFAAVKRHLDETQAAAKTTSESMGNIGQSLLHGLQAAGIVIGFQQVIGAMKEMVSSAVDMGMELGHLSQQTGISTQNLSVLRYTAEQTGVSFETFTKGFKKMSTDIFDWQHGMKVGGEAFGALGISMADVKAKGQDMFSILEMIASKFQTMPNGPEKLAIAVKLFGRAGQELIPVLNQGAAGLEEYKAQAQALGLVLDQSAIQKVEELHSEMVKLKGAVEGGALAFSGPLATALEGIGKDLYLVVGGTNLWAAAGQQAALTLLPLVDMLSQLRQAVRGLGDDWVIANDRLKNATTVPLIASPWNKALRDQQAAAKAARDKEIQDARADHAAAYADEVKFHEDMLALKNNIEHPGAVSHTSFSAPGGAEASDLSGFADPQAAKKKMLADRTAFAEQKNNHAMSIEEEIAFWQKRIGAFKRGSSQYLEVLNEINTLIAEKGKQDLSVRDNFTEEAIEQAKQKKEADERIREAVGEAWKGDLNNRVGLSEGAERTARATADANARIAEATVEHEKLAKTITEVSAAQQLASIHATQYAAEIAALNAELKQLEQLESLGADTAKKEADIRDQITGLRGEAQAAAIIDAPVVSSTNQIEGAAEKYAHGVFDPLFNFGERWSKQWKHIQANMLSDMGQTAESKLFGILFGDPNGRGGKGWAGTSFQGDTTNPHGGVQGAGYGLMGSLLGAFHRKASPVSNGTGAQGAGTVLSAAASAMQIGNKGAAGGAGVQVILNNNGSPLQVSQTQHSNNGGENQVIQIILKQLDTNGPVAMGIRGMMGMG